MKNDIDDLIKVDCDVDTEVLKKIKKGTRKNILKSNILLLVIIIGCLIGLNFILQMAYYNPLADYEDEMGASSKFEVLMNVELALTTPGYHYSMLDGRSYGFSYYQIDGYFNDYVSYYIATNNSEITMMLGKASINGPLTSYYMNRFIEPDGPYQDVANWSYIERKTNILNELQQLPSTSTFDVYVTFKEPIEIDEVLKYGNDDYLIWIMCDMVDYKYYGIRPNDIFGYEFSEKFNQLYPGIEPNYNDAMTSDYLKERYLSSIKLLMDNQKFIDSLSGYGFSVDNRKLNQLLDNAKQGIMAKGMRINIGRDNLIELINDDNTYYVDIDNVRYSSFEK